MGSIRDSRGVEQGVVNSDNFYKMETVNLASPLGTLPYPLPKLMMSTNNIYCISNHLHLTLLHCSNYQIELVANNTKLQVFLPKSYEVL